MPATPLCILLTLLAADPTGHAAKPPALEGALAAVQTKKSERTVRSSSRSRAAAKPSTAKKATTRKSTTRKSTAKKATSKRTTAKNAKATKRTSGKSAARAGPTDLARARALLRAVKKDPERRRYKHEWEKAIRALERAARGRERGPALLDAARARYALYRYSSDESDRDLALSLARKARAAGARDALTFIQAVRREAGDERPREATATARARVAKRSTDAASTASAEHTPDAPQGSRVHGAADGDEPPDTDPVLDRILAQLAEDPREGSIRDVLPTPPAAPEPAVPTREASPSAAQEQVAVARTAPTPAPAGGSRLGAAAAQEGAFGPIRKIVIDPGHGGHDSGAVGPTRVREKDVVLAIAKRLARKLRAAGYEVVLTREGDRYLALAERTALANAHQGDLFVSIHANAHPRRDRQGVETWVLDVTSDRYATRLAARENGIVEDADSPLDLRHILADLDAKVSAQASRRLARIVQDEVTSGIRGRFGPVRDLGVKSALFYVLLGARMPAVLVETSFISNRAEEKRLKSSKFQEEVASALVRAIDTFAAQQSRIAAR